MFLLEFTNNNVIHDAWNTWPIAFPTNIRPIGGTEAHKMPGSTTHPVALGWKQTRASGGG